MRQRVVKFPRQRFNARLLPFCPQIVQNSDYPEVIAALNLPHVVLSRVRHMSRAVIGEKIRQIRSNCGVFNAGGHSPLYFRQSSGLCDKPDQNRKYNSRCRMIQPFPQCSIAIRFEMSIGVPWKNMP